MWQFLLKRLLLLFVTLFGIAVISFLIVTMAPGDPASLKASAMGKGRASGISEFTTRKNRELFFLDRPILLNTSPANRTKSVSKALGELNAALELERKDAKSRLVNDMGTAALEGLVGALPELLARSESGALERKQALAALDGAEGDVLLAALDALAVAYPAYEPRLAHHEGVAPPPERFAEVWRRQRKTLLDEAEAPVKRALEVLGSIIPRGGPELAKDAKPADAVAAWQAWWTENQASYTPDAAATAAKAYLVTPGETEGTPEKASLETVGQLAAPTLMEAFQDADEGSDAERRAAAGLALVCKKPWKLKLSEPEMEKLKVEWASKKKALEDEKAQAIAKKEREGALEDERKKAIAEAKSKGATKEEREQAIAEAENRVREENLKRPLTESEQKTFDGIYGRLLARHGAEEAYVETAKAKALDKRRHSWSTWWYRAAEYSSDFGVLQQARRAVSQTQFGRWMSRLVVFDFGESYKHKRPVSELILERFWVTLSLNVPSIILIYLFAIPIGIYSATHQRSVGDRITTIGLFVLYSIPSFWAGSMLIMLLTGEPFLDLFPAYHIESLDSHTFTTGQKLLDWTHHGTLPVICLTYGGLAYVAKQMRSGMLDVIRQDYIRTAKAKGLPYNKVIYKHALRNGLIPILTLMASLLPVLFGGSVIIETIFSIEGLGKLAFEAIFDRDYPVIMANLVISGFLTLLGILATDIAYAIVDPRIEYR